MISEDYHCVRYVPAHYFHVYAIELRITTVSVCHICLAHPSLGASLCTSGLVSVSPSQMCPTCLTFPSHISHVLATFDVLQPCRYTPTWFHLPQPQPRPHAHAPTTLDVPTAPDTRNYEKLTGHLNPLKILNLQKHLQVTNILYN